MKRGTWTFTLLLLQLLMIKTPTNYICALHCIFWITIIEGAVNCKVSASVLDVRLVMKTQFIFPSLTSESFAGIFQYRLSTSILRNKFPIKRVRKRIARIICGDLLINNKRFKLERTSVDELKGRDDFKGVRCGWMWVIVANSSLFVRRSIKNWFM